MSFNQIILRSYAKINLGLQVLEKRSDGYHEIRTVMQSIALHDRLTLERTRQKRIRFHSDCQDLDPYDNLVVRAIQLFQQKTKLSTGLSVSLEKKVPIGSGLGGGSSNAALTLFGLNRMFGLNLPIENLLEWSSLLGSDVPFFLVGGKCLGIGRGSEIYPLEELPRKYVLLALPSEGVSTVGAYARLSLRLTKPVGASIIPVFCSGYLDGLNEGKGQGNDFEQVFFEDFPQFQRVKDAWFRCGAEAAGLTGSGSALFGVFGGKKILSKAVSAIDRKELRLIQTSTLNRLQYQRGLVESLH